MCTVGLMWNYVVSFSFLLHLTSLLPNFIASCATCLIGIRTALHAMNFNDRLILHGKKLNYTTELHNTE